MRRRASLAALAFVVAVVPPIHAQLADEPSRREAFELFRVGQEYLSAEQFERAADAFSRAIQKDRFLSIAHYGLGQSYMNLRRYASAVQAYKGCVEATRLLHDLQLTNQFAVDRQRESEIQSLKSMRDGNWRGLSRPSALALEQRLRDLENQRHSIASVFQPPAEVLLALGSAYFRNEDRDAAEATWKAAIDVNPKYGEAHNNIAVIYMQTDRVDKALEEVRLAENAGFKVNPQFKADLRDKAKSPKR